MTWTDLLFAHWPADAETLRGMLPPGLELDMYAGDAWVGVVPFRMSGVRLRGLPSMPGAGTFPELNLRTYVRRGGKRGVWFFALDAASALAVHAARAWFGLPYFRARMRSERAGDAIEYRSERVEGSYGGAPAGVRVRYEPSGPVELARAGSLEEFLTERYCLYAVDRRGRLRRGDIHHARWPLQPARAVFEECTLPAAHGIEPAKRAPHLLFARELEVVAWSPVLA